ncbi:MAG: hypothetical protein ACYCUI_15875 [Vulcanimicrobiaceae bacterium]
MRSTLVRNGDVMELLAAGPHLRFRRAARALGADVFNGKRVRGK